MRAAVAIEPVPRRQVVSVTRDTLEITFFLMHVPLGLLMNASKLAATAHAGITWMVALTVAFTSTSWVRLSSVAAYIVGSEVLWRMCDARIPWESGKYAMSGILLLGLFRAKGRRAVGLFAVVYLLFLLPSSVYTLFGLPMEEARQQLSFNLSGPFSLAVATLLFSRIELSMQEVSKVMRSAAMPVVGVLAICAYSMATAGHISFAGDSNQIASGRFGPNQVSTALGLAGLLLFQALLVPGAKRSIRYVMIGLVILFLAQSALTFSRGGFYAAILAAVAGGMFAINDRRSRARLMATVLFLGVVAEFAVMPSLVNFTEGHIVRRFTDSDTSGRWDLMIGELILWKDNPILGVGPGMAKSSRESFEGMPAHTELTRSLAEHGTLGLLAQLMLVFAILAGLQRARDRSERVLLVVLTSWALLTMVHSAMRLAAPGFCFGLGFSLLVARTRSRRSLARPVPTVRARPKEPAVAQ